MRSRWRNSRSGWRGNNATKRNIYFLHFFIKLFIHLILNKPPYTMNKLFFFSMAFSAILFVSCDKSDLPSVNQPASTSETDHPHNGSPRSTFVDFNYTLTKDDNGNYSCPSPKVDCTKISPDPLFSFSAINTAIESGASAVESLFNSADWEEKFPIPEELTGVISGLQHGTYTIVRTVNSNGDVFYFVIPTTKISSYTKTDIIYTTMLPK